MANEIKLKPSFTDNDYIITKEATTPAIYEETQWHTGDVITQEKMMKIEEWLRSSANELLVARRGKTVSGNNNTWNNIKERFDYLTNILRITTPEGSESLIQEIEDAIERADSAATSIEEMTISEQTLNAGIPARVINWEKVDDHWALTLGIPVTNFTTTTTTTSDGSTDASVTVDNNIGSLTRNLAFSIPIPKYTINSTTTTHDGTSPAAVTIDTTNKLNPKLDFSIPVPKIDINSTVTTNNKNANVTIDYSKYLNPKLNFTIPAHKITQVIANQLAPGASPTASITYPDANTLDATLTLGLPLAKPIDVVKTYSSIAELQANIRSDVPVGLYAIVANSVNDQDNGRIYIRTEDSPYYSFIADIAAATPTFRIGTVNVLDATGTKNASIDVTDPENPILNLDLPAVPVFNSNVNVTTIAADQPASASLSGPATAKQLSLSIPRGRTPNFTIGTVTTGAPGTNASAIITGTSDNPILNLTIPRGNTGSIENLPIATTEFLGAVIVGDNLTITPEGVLSAIASTARSEDIVILTNQWELQNGVYTVTISSIENIDEKTECTVKMDDTYFNLITSLSAETTDQGTIIFRTNQLPSGPLNITLILQQVG